MPTTFAAAALASVILAPVPAGAATPLAEAGATTPLAKAGVATPAKNARAAAPPGLASCGPGELCLWGKAQFKGARQTYELSGIDIESCVALPEGGSAQALANRTGRPVTTYQSAECGETGEFDTYPGGGTWLPESPYRVRAFKVWES
ncbi:peptidase inhibitor family I36 protein [Streptomyces longisporoflavus]|uniref:peptidase inhibitor family I36 protein n=1 Tax=Streptomyces longisporoflavus TaxID=28044 RepID=UPI00167C9CB8|nr:peptidase inhibitor family I36 protein [Streptomyces longisporoflavus]